MVLRVNEAARTLTLHYVADGLGADCDWEAFELVDCVPAHHVRPAPASVCHFLGREGCSWTARSQQVIRKICEDGLDNYLAAQGYLNLEVGTVLAP